MPCKIQARAILEHMGDHLEGLQLHTEGKDAF